MLRYSWKNRSGQIISAEYVVIFFVVMGVMSAMFIYFQRTFQARIRDARNAMLKAVIEEAIEDDFVQFEPSHEFIEYEPYYGNTTSIISQKRNEGTRMYGVKWGEHYQKKYLESINIEAASRTASPSEVP